MGLFASSAGISTGTWLASAKTAPFAIFIKLVPLQFLLIRTLFGENYTGISSNPLSSTVMWIWWIFITSVSGRRGKERKKKKKTWVGWCKWAKSSYLTSAEVLQTWEHRSGSPTTHLSSFVPRTRLHLYSYNSKSSWSYGLLKSYESYGYSAQRSPYAHIY